MHSLHDLLAFLLNMCLVDKDDSKLQMSRNIGFRQVKENETQVFIILPTQLKS